MSGHLPGQPPQGPTTAGRVFGAVTPHPDSQPKPSHCLALSPSPWLSQYHPAHHLSSLRQPNKDFQHQECRHHIGMSLIPPDVGLVIKVLPVNLPQGRLEETNTATRCWQMAHRKGLGPFLVTHSSVKGVGAFSGRVAPLAQEQGCKLRDDLVQNCRCKGQSVAQLLHSAGSQGAASATVPGPAPQSRARAGGPQGPAGGRTGLRGSPLQG